MTTRDEIVTARAERILDFITRFIYEHGYAPTFAEIGKGCDISSTSIVSSYVRRLEKMGKIKYTPKAARSIVVLEEAWPT
jgi:SOS-response transcriptional repressor LexA